MRTGINKGTGLEYYSPTSTSWPGGLAGGPWRAGRKRPVQQHRKPWPLERTRTYRPWMEGVDYPSRRRRLAAELHGNSALDWGDLHIPLGRSTVKGGEDGGGTRPVSGRKGALQDLVTSSCTSREERNRRRLPAIGLRPQEPIVQP